jgi:hypothetical protein
MLVRESYRADTRYRGVALRIHRQLAQYENQAGQTSWGWTCELQASYAPRPIVLSLFVEGVGWPHVATGDASFEQRFRLSGAPSEVLRRAFDAELRGQVMSATDAPMFYGDDGFIKVGVTSSVEGGGDPQALQARADLLIAVTQRLCGEFDREHAAITARSGPAVAAKWSSDQAAAVAKAGRARTLRAVLIVGVILLIPAIIAAIWIMA